MWDLSFCICVQVFVPRLRRFWTSSKYFLSSLEVTRVFSFFCWDHSLAQATLWSELKMLWVKLTFFRFYENSNKFGIAFMKFLASLRSLSFLSVFWSLIICFSFRTCRVWRLWGENKTLATFFNLHR